MTVIAALQDADNLVVEPGQSVSCRLSLSNTGSIVEQFAIMVLGEGAEWISSDPPVVSMFPGAQQTVTLRFSPPREHSTPAGVVPFAVKVIPSNEPDDTVTEEGQITVGSFNDVGAELLPRVVNGRVGGRQRLAVDSRGNVPVPVSIGARDPADALRFRFRPESLTTVPGSAHFIRIRMRPRKRFWKGPAQLKQYQVQVDAAGEKPLVLDGQFKQGAVIPKWVYGLVALVAAAVLLWYLLLRPVIRDTAQNANKAALAAQAQQTKQLQSQVSQAQQSASQANQAASQALGALGKKPPATTTTSTTTTTTTVPGTTTSTTAPPVTGPGDGHVETVAAPGSTATNSAFTVPSGTTVEITNLVLENVSGSSGTARIERLIPGQPTQDLLVVNLATLNEQEFTFNTPMVFSHDQQLQLRVDCAGDQTACDVFLYYTGPETTPAASTTTTIP